MILAPLIAALAAPLVAAGIPLIAAQAIIGIGLAVGSMMLMRLLTPRQRPPGQEFEAKVGANVPLFCVYGRQKIAGFIMPPVQTSRRVTHVRVVGVGWHDAIEAILIDGQRCRFNGIAGQWSDAGKPFQGGMLGGIDPSGPGNGIGDPPWTPGLQADGPNGSEWVTTVEFGNNVRVQFYDGRPSQNSSGHLATQSGEDGLARKLWTPSHGGNGVAYVLVDVEPDQNKNLSANPSIEFIVRGRRLWDPRKDEAYGGTGDHDRADPATWEWSDNCALAATDYRLGLFIGGKKVLGIGTPIARIRMDSRIAAANVCDTPRPLLDDLEEPMWRIAAVISNDRVHRENLQVFYDAMAGWETERGGTYRLVAGGPQVPVVAITDADLVKGPRKYKARKQRSDRYNGVTGKFADPFHAYELQDLPLRTSTEDEGEDGGERLLMTLTLSQVPSQTQAQHLMEIARRRARLQTTATVTVPPRLRDPEVMDAITWSSGFHGGGAKTFQIQSPWAKNRNMTLTWGLVETSDQIWPWDPDEDQLDPLVAADLPAAIDKLAEVPGFAVSASSEPGDGEQVIPVFLCTWTAIDDLSVDAVIVKYRVIGAAEWSQQRFDTTDTLAAGEGTIRGVQADTPYEFEADLITTPPRYTTVATPAPVTSGPDHVVKRAVIGDTVGPGGVSWDALEARLQAASRLPAAFMRDINLRLDELGGAVAVIETESSEANRALTERASRISASLGGAKSSVQVLEAAQSSLEDSFALFQVDTEASFDDISANGLLQFQQVVSPPTGATSGVQMLVEALDAGGFAQAGLEAYAFAGGGGSPDGFTVLVGDRIYRRSSSGGAPQLIVNSDGELVSNGIAIDQATKWQAVIDATATTYNNTIGYGTVFSTSFSLAAASVVALDCQLNHVQVSGSYAVTYRAFLNGVQVGTFGPILGQIVRLFLPSTSLAAGSHTWLVDAGNAGFGGTYTVHPRTLGILQSIR